MALITVHLNAGIILVVTSDRYTISFLTLFPRFCQSLISLVVSVDVKHHVYLAIIPEFWSCVKVEVA